MSNIWCTTDVEGGSRFIGIVCVVSEKKANIFLGVETYCENLHLKN